MSGPDTGSGPPGGPGRLGLYASLAGIAVALALLAAFVALRL